MENKLCIYCEYFGMEEANIKTLYDTYGSSDYPANSKILCKKGHWETEVEPGYYNISSYRTNIETGLTCKEFEHFKELE